MDVERRRGGVMTYAPTYLLVLLRSAVNTGSIERG
jgi:hypothetical protein